MPCGAPENHVLGDAKHSEVLADKKDLMAAKSKRNSVPQEKRVTIDLCESGDIAELRDGRRCVVTSRLNGGPFGRWLSADGTEGEFVPIPGALACRVVGR